MAGIAAGAGIGLGLGRRLASLGLGSALLRLGRRLALLVGPVGPPLWVVSREQPARVDRRVERGA